MRHSRRGPLWAGMAVVAVVLAGCANNVRASSTTTSRPDLSLSGKPGGQGSAASASSADEAAVLRSYRGMWDNFLKVGKAPDGDSPLLAQFTAGGQLRRNREWMAGFARRGVTLRGTVRSDPRVVALVPKIRAVVQDCVDSSKWVEVDAAGRTIPNKAVAPDLNIATLEPVHGVWKVTNNTVVLNRC